MQLARLALQHRRMDEESLADSTLVTSRAVFVRDSLV